MTMETSVHKESEARTWILAVLLAALILAKGFFAFFVIGDRGQPGWDFPVVADVPAESPYAIYKLLPYPQHVRGAKGD